jgi:hypothetical protein
MYPNLCFNVLINTQIFPRKTLPKNLAYFCNFQKNFQKLDEKVVQFGPPAKRNCLNLPELWNTLNSPLISSACFQLQV